MRDFLHHCKIRHHLEFTSYSILSQQRASQNVARELVAFRMANLPHALTACIEGQSPIMCEIRFYRWLQMYLNKYMLSVYLYTFVEPQSS